MPIVEPVEKHPSSTKYSRIYSRGINLPYMLQVFKRTSTRGFLSLPFASNPLHTHKLSKRVNIPSDIIFEVVSDVPSYKAFIPFVTDSFIHEIDPLTGLPSKAGFEVGWNSYEEHMVCDVTCVKNKRVFSKACSSTVFDYLQNEWTFKSLRTDVSGEDVTEVNLDLQYRFKNPLLNSIASIFQHQVSQIMIDSFLKRAVEKQNLNTQTKSLS